MQHRSIQTAFKIFILLSMTTLLSAIEVPVRKNVTIEVPLKEFTVIKFPFKVTKTQLGVFTYLKAKSRKKPKLKNNGTKKISLSRKKKTLANKGSTQKNNILNIKKIDNMLTLRPSLIGETEIIVWGNEDYPMVVKIKVVEDADSNIDFIRVVDERKNVEKFESNPHEKIIELLMRTLFNSEVNPKPRGYEEVDRREEYDVGIEDDNGFVYTRVRVALTREYVGKRYVGQVWNVNLVPEFDSDGETVSLPKDFKLTLFYEMFDSPGVYAISLESYSIDKKHGTRLMIVRSKEN